MTRTQSLRTQVLGMASAAVVAATAGCGAATAGTTPGTAMGAAMGQPASAVIAGWPQTSREVAQTIIQKYGAPSEATASMLVWHNNGPWKRTIVYRDTVPHHFPMPHPDLLEQVVDYRAPLDRYDDLAMYDGSVIVERTKGEISARCDKEGANFLALNLANEIATGRRTVEDARRMYGEQVTMMKNGQMTPYTSGLMFTPPPSGNDPDRPIM
ncbi:MAG: hypothetical protein KY467_09360 [Gemmatimonadetes bacterium]|nr:hypothetical protein [Gemmatimonadota bacterium]